MTANTATAEQGPNQSTVPPEITDKGLDLERQSSQMLEVAQAYTIDSDDMYELAGRELVEIKERAKAIDEERQQIKRPALETCRRIDAFFRVPLDRLKQAEQVLKSAMSQYFQAQEAKRREAKRLADEQARKDREREEAERKARLEQEKAAADQRETEALEKAEALASAGKHEEADRVLMEAELEPRHNVAPEPDPIPDVPAIPVPEAPKAAGVSHRTTWKARVIDKRALLQAVLDDKAPESLILVDEKKLNQLARSLGEDLKYPGVESYPEQTVAAGRR